MNEPLVTCIMPTIPARAEWARRALRLFEAQTYPHKELVSTDADGTIGAKRNYLCSIASGDLIMHWDDDDYYSPNRIARQVELALRHPGAITGFCSARFVDLQTGVAWEYGGTDFVLGASMCYSPETWRQKQFEDRNVFEDGKFLAGRSAFGIHAGDDMICTIHPGNTSSRDLAKSPWKISENFGGIPW